MSPIPSGTPSSTTSAPSSAPGAGSLIGAAREVFGSPGRKVALVVVAAVVALAYTLLLPFDFTQRLELANWDYLTAYQATWSVVLGVAMGLVMVVQIYAMRRVAQARASAGTVGGVAFVVSLLPSFLCCTPFVPTVLAFVGISGLSLYSTTGAVQHFFAVHQSDLLAASLVLLVLTGWWGLHKVATASCLSAEGCDVVLGDACCDPSPATHEPASARSQTVGDQVGASSAMAATPPARASRGQASLEQGAQL